MFRRSPSSDGSIGTRKCGRGKNMEMNRIRQNTSSMNKSVRQFEPSSVITNKKFSELSPNFSSIPGLKIILRTSCILEFHKLCILDTTAVDTFWPQRGNNAESSPQRYRFNLCWTRKKKLAVVWATWTPHEQRDYAAHSSASRIYDTRMQLAAKMKKRAVILETGFSTSRCTCWSRNTNTSSCRRPSYAINQIQWLPRATGA